METYAAPEGDTETVLAEIWAALLGLEQVGRLDNFFTLGGHSLLVIRLIAELQAKGLNTDVRAVFNHPVLKDLALVVNSGANKHFEAPPNLIPEGCEQITPELLPLIALEQAQIDQIGAQVPGGIANIQDIYPLGPLQEGILFHHMLGSPEDGDTYIMPVMLAVSNRLQLDKFIDVLKAVVKRHDVLRTAIFWEGLPRPVQVVLRHCELNLRHIELDPVGDAIVQLRERIEPERLWMDLTRAPLLRVELAADPNSEQHFVIIYEHHIVNDHIGLEVLVEEMGVLLDASDAELPPTVPYREFVAHALALAESGETEHTPALVWGMWTNRPSRLVSRTFRWPRIRSMSTSCRWSRVSAKDFANKSGDWTSARRVSFIWRGPWWWHAAAVATTWCLARCSRAACRARPVRTAP